MKKVYIHPQIQVRLLDFEETLMAGSGTKTDTVMQFDGDADENDEADAKQTTFGNSFWDED